MRTSTRSSRGVATVFGSRFWGGGRGEELVVVSTVASSCLKLVCLKVRVDKRGLNAGCCAFRKHLSAGRMT